MNEDKFFAVYMSVVFTMLGVSLFEGIDVVTLRAVAAGMMLAFVPGIIIVDKIREAARNLHESYHGDHVRDTAVREVMRTNYPNN